MSKALLVLLLTAISVADVNAQVIDTRDPNQTPEAAALDFYDNGYFMYLGVGQTFTVPTNIPYRLSSISFWMYGTNGWPVHFNFYLFRWDPVLGRPHGANPPGGQIFPDPPPTPLLTQRFAGPISGGLQQFTVMPGHPITLKHNQMYLAMLYPEDSFGTSWVPIYTDSYSGGYMIQAGSRATGTSNIPFDTRQVSDWSTGDTGYDMALMVEGQVVPEPATMILLGSGLIGLGAAARRRRKH